MVNKLFLCCVVHIAVVLFANMVSANTQTSLDNLLTPYLSRYELPALAAAVVQDGKIVAAGAVGTRKAGVTIPVTINDRFYLGSDTKAITSLLVAMFVDEGKLRWDSTMAELFPELADRMDPGFKTITVTQLLSHSNGVAPDNEALMNLYLNANKIEGNLDEMRYSVLRDWCSHPLESAPGTKFAYANMNYIIAGAILERLSHKTWEELARERIFIPLGLTTAGFGPQATPGEIDAPLGHVMINGKPKFYLAGPAADCPPVMGPAGTVHMSVLDFARWAGWNAGEGKRGPALATPATLKKLHTPVIATEVQKNHTPGTPGGGQYALGWGVVTLGQPPVTFLMHSGSNGENLAYVSVDLKHDFAMVLLTNMGGTKAEEALTALAPQLYHQFAPTDHTEKNSE